MISQKNDQRYSCHRLFLMALSIILLMAAGSIIGCSNSSGDSAEYRLIGYDGVSDFESSSTAGPLGAGNSGLKFFAQAPWYVNITLQVTDASGIGVSGLKAADFNIHENSALLDPITSNINIRRRDLLPPEYEYQLKTVFLIDNSATVSAETLDHILKGALSVLEEVDSKLQQEFAIVAFDNDGDPELIRDFTPYGSTLTTYLTPGSPQAIKRSFGAANFYGAVQYALGLWEENPSPASKELTQGFVVAITQGNDTAGFYGVNDAIAARDKDNKRVVTVPVGSKIPAGVLADMERLGSGWYYPVSDTDNLAEQMKTIQKRMVAFADGFYWIQYRSEKFGAPGSKLDHTLEVAVDGNPNTGNDAIIAGSFSSREFIAGNGVYFNASAADPSGIKKITFVIERGQAAGIVTEQSDVSALTYSRTGKVPSKFTWTSGDNNVVTVAPKSGNTAAAVITVNNTGETTIRVTDTANDVSAILNVEVVVREFSYEILKHELESERPWNVDATFQVRETDPTDKQWKWITNMKREEFTLFENKGTASQNQVDRETSETNLRKRNRLPSDYSYTLKTVLLIDNSPSTDADGDNLALMKEAAKAFVRRAFVDDPKDDTDKGPLLNATNGNQQEIAIWSFTEKGDSRLVQNFTTDKDTLNAAIDSIPPGVGAINFYGGMVHALRLWQNNQAPRSGDKMLRQGVLVVLTDGWESLSGFGSKAAVIGEIKDNKQVVCVGVGDDLVTQANRNDLKAFGNAGYYSVPDPGTDLVNTARHIQDEIVDFANSFYWLNYKSYIYPAGNCANTTDLDISINDNANPNQQSISGAFETCDFFDGIPGKVYVNPTATNPWGEEEFVIRFVASAYPFFADWAAAYPSPTVPLEAVTYKATSAPNYAWSSSNSNTVIVAPDTDTYGNSVAILRLPANPRAGTALIRAKDQGNNTEKTITVRVERIEIPVPIAHYPFSGDAVDATGNGYDGEVFGATTLAADRFSNSSSAYSFGGGYIALNMFYGPNDRRSAWAGETVNQITVGAWIKTQINIEKQLSIVSFDRAEYWHLFMSTQTRGTMQNAGWDATNTARKAYGLSSVTDYTVNNWHFVVATYNSTVGKLYIDGQEVASRNANGAMGTGLESWGFIGVESKARAYNGDKVLPPIWYDPTNNTYFYGLMDDVMIFHQALTPEQVLHLYQISK